MNASKMPPPPEQLGEAGRALWTAVTGAFNLDVRELRLLGAAGATADELARLEEALAGAAVLSVGSMGQPVGHPLLGEVRGHRRLLGQLLGALDLPAEVAEVPAGSRPRAVRSRGYAS